MAKSDQQKFLERREALIVRWAEIFSISLKRSEELLSLRQRSAVRINCLRPGGEGLIEQLDPSNFIEVTPRLFSYLKLNKADLSRSVEFSDGKVAILNLSSLIPVLALDLDPKLNQKVLDACAAPGSKSALIAERIKNPQTNLYLNDASSARIAKLKAHLAKLGVPFAALSCLDLSNKKTIAALQKVKFNKVLLDVPCSGDGQVDLDNPKSVISWNVKKVQRLAKLQLKILNNLWDAVPIGAEIVYSTCAASPEENELVIARFLRSHPEAELLNLSGAASSLKINPTIVRLTEWRGKDLSLIAQKTLRILPDQNYIAFFCG